MGQRTYQAIAGKSSLLLAEDVTRALKALEEIEDAVQEIVIEIKSLDEKVRTYGLVKLYFLPAEIRTNFAEIRAELISRGRDEKAV